VKRAIIEEAEAVDAGYTHAAFDPALPAPARRHPDVRVTLVERSCRVCGRRGLDVLPARGDRPQRCYPGNGCNSFEGAQKIVERLTRGGR